MLALVTLLGADNFEDWTLEVLAGLSRLRRGANPVLAQPAFERLRSEIARFTVRRTKAALNELGGDPMEGRQTAVGMIPFS